MIMKDISPTITVHGGPNCVWFEADGENTPPQVRVVGNVMPSGHRVGRVVDPEGLSPTVMLNQGYPVLIVEEWQIE